MEVLSIGIIRVFSTDNQEVLNAHGNKIESLYGIDCINRSISNQEKGIFDKTSEELAIPKIIKLAKEFERDGVKGIAISCAADPALKEVRELLNIPVIGAGSSAAYLAKSVSSNIGVLTIANEVPSIIKEILGSSLVSWRKPIGINNTADLLKSEAIEKSLDASEQLIKDGADTIVFACTGYITIGFEKILKNHFDVKIIDPVAAEGNVISFILKGD